MFKVKEITTGEYQRLFAIQIIYLFTKSSKGRERGGGIVDKDNCQYRRRNETKIYNFTELQICKLFVAGRQSKWNKLRALSTPPIQTCNGHDFRWINSLIKLIQRANDTSGALTTIRDEHKRMNQYKNGFWNSKLKINDQVHLGWRSEVEWCGSRGRW